MEQPDYSDLEKRVAKLEDERDDVVTIAKEGLRLSKLHGFNLQQVLAVVGRNELNLGTALERLDRIEQTLATKEDIAEIKVALAGHSERFDQLGHQVSSLDGKMDQILALLQPPEGEPK